MIGAGSTGLAHVDALRAAGCSDLFAWAPSGRAKVDLEHRGVEFCQGSLEAVLKDCQPCRVVVATPIETLSNIAQQVVASGVQDVLMEKPGALFHHEAVELSSLASHLGINVYVGMNRRFLPSVITALEWLSTEDATLISGFFDFSETQDVLQRLDSKVAVVRDRWLIANAIHVIDTAFLPIGLPTLVQAHCNTSKVVLGERLRAFTGFTIGHGGVNFAYQSIWGSGSRWRVEWHTDKGSIFLEPLETARLATANRPFRREPLFDERDDRQLKPGFLGQARAFLGGPGKERLMRIQELPQLIETIDRIACTEAGQSGVS